MITLTRTQLALLLVPLLALLTVAGSRLAGVGANEGPAEAAPLARLDGPSRGRRRSGAARRPRRRRRPAAGPLPARGGRAGRRRARARRRRRRTEADLSAVNLAAPLADGQQVVVPRRAPPRRGGRRRVRLPPGAKVSLGIATVEQLDELPGIGPITAQKIVDWRAAHGPFRSVEDLDDVPGIGPARIEQLRELVTP